MSFEPLLTEPQPIPPHALAAIAGLIVGLVQFAMPKGTLPHRVLGYVWVGLMLLVAASSLFIFKLRMIGPFSPIHLLSVLMLVGLYQAVRYARQGNIKAHRSTMLQLFGFGLIVAGGFTFLPGRTMHTVLFGS